MTKGRSEIRGCATCPRHGRLSTKPRSDFLLSSSVMDAFRHGLEVGASSYYASVTMKPCRKHAVLQCLCAIVGRNLLLQTFLALTITTTVSDVI